MRKERFEGPRARRIAVVVAGAMVVVQFALSLGDDDGLRLSTVARITRETLVVAPDQRSVPTLAARARVDQVKAKKLNTGILVNSETSLSRRDLDLCLIRKTTSISLEGEIRVQSIEKSDGARAHWIKSSTCPDELYSIVSIDRENRIEKLIDCQNTGLTELALNSGLQFAIMTVVPAPNIVSLAIEGLSRILVNCPDTGLTITRDGFFKRRGDFLTNAEGCVAWTRKDSGRPVRIKQNERIAENGCTLSGQECFEIVEFDERDVEAFNFKTGNSLSVLNERGIKLAAAPRVLENSAEDLGSADRSLTGVANWEPLKPTRMPAACP